MDFCQTVMEAADRDPNFLSNILFTDESSFPLHGKHNPSVKRCWARENPRFHYNARTQYSQKVNVWAGILGGNIIGPFLINGNLNAAKYLELLQNQILPAIRAFPIPFETIWFQQDGCPSHNANQVRRFLQETFPNRLIA